MLSKQSMDYLQPENMKESLNSVPYAALMFILHCDLTDSTLCCPFMPIQRTKWATTWKTAKCMRTHTVVPQWYSFNIVSGPVSANKPLKQTITHFNLLMLLPTDTSTTPTSIHSNSLHLARAYSFFLLIYKPKSAMSYLLCIHLVYL